MAFDFSEGLVVGLGLPDGAEREALREKWAEFSSNIATYVVRAPLALPVVIANVQEFWAYLPGGLQSQQLCLFRGATPLAVCLLMCGGLARRVFQGASKAHMLG